MPIHLVLADDHPIVLDGLENLFRVEPDIRVVARCVNGEEALTAVNRHRPDVLLLDLHLPRKDGLTVLRELHAKKVGTKVVILAAVLEESEALEAFRLGVCGMLLKEQAPQMVVRCVRRVHAGEQWVEKHACTRALHALLEREAGESAAAGVLTPREIQMVRMAACGLRNREISRRLAISEGTVKIHLHNIYQKLKVENRVQLTLCAQSKKLV
jgi:DNA-binding NarL/FixJ family response regulator